MFQTKLSEKNESHILHPVSSSGKTRAFEGRLKKVAKLSEF